ncbi:unnamed protein product [Adineta steineri]|uniref:Myotubularin phosphatase domain-containing protein n=1 Tax=Adineta steineri TaxID=433720 RepID=A0A813XYZ8_9BILA|nr:unnamed protein product [Adineta steineri]CAF0875263.1 unnamed protein product [Adineta steineri]
MSRNFLEKSKIYLCPGKYCGYQNNSTNCGACQRGYRVNTESICQLCHETLSLYNFMYIVFMALLALSFHWYFINRLQKKKQREFTLVKQTILYFLSILEILLAFIFTLLTFPPIGKLTMNVCQVKLLSDFYPMFHNPIVNYRKKLRCSYEVVYPLQSAIFVLYTYASLIMLLLRPLFVSIIHQKFISASIYSALHFYPCLLILHALCGGFIYFSFPILTITSAIFLNAIHFTLIANGENNWISFIRKLCGNIQNWIIYLVHVILLLCGLISLTQFEDEYHLILLPTVFLPVFRDHLQSYPESIVNVTLHNVIITHKQSDGNYKELWIFYTNMDAIQPKFPMKTEFRSQLPLSPSMSSTYTIIVRLKTLETCYFDVSVLDDAIKLAESLDALITYTDGLNCDVTFLFPFCFPRDFEVIQDGWTAFSVESEFSRLQAISDEWRISDVNKNFAICETYPERLVVPKSITDEYLKRSAQFRSHGRFPLLCYLHKSSKSCIIRCAQPLIGSSVRRCKEDEGLVNAMLTQRHKKGWILDTRHANVVKSAQNKGGGCEPDQHYALWKRLHRHLDKHNVLQESFTKLMDACIDQSEKDRWLSKLDNSNWLLHVKEALTTACIVAQTIDCEETSVLIHGSDGWDTTLLVTSLAQILLDPDCRTITGFEALIEREWIQAGHPFRLRCSRSGFGRSTHGQESPLFTLFLDCTWQLLQQFACSFEFNDTLLIELFQHAYSSKFGTFIFNNEKEKLKYNGIKHTVSLWSYFNRPEILHAFLNPFYEPNLSVLWPSVAAQSIILWRSLYLRFYENQIPQREVWDEYLLIKGKEIQLRSYVNKLRQELLELERKCTEKTNMIKTEKDSVVTI